MNYEKMLPFVAKRLQNKLYNRAEISRRTGISQVLMCQIATGARTSAKLEKVETLFHFFKQHTL